MMVIHQVLGLSQAFLSWDGKHLLSVTCVRCENGSRVPIFQLVQQPSPILKYSYESNPEAFALILRETAQKNFEMPSATPSPEGVGRVITEAMPVSFRFPTTIGELDAAQSHKWSTMPTIEDVKSIMPAEWDKLTKFERQRGWYIDVKYRPSSAHKDTFYIHLQSKLKVRSKVEVYYFIETGKRPTQGDTSAITAELQKINGGSKQIRGKELVEMRKVGHYDEVNKKIHRWPVTPTKDQATSSGTAKRGNRKRKREEVSVEEVKDANSNSEKIYELYDFQSLI